MADPGVLDSSTAAVLAKAALYCRVVSPSEKSKSLLYPTKNPAQIAIQLRATYDKCVRSIMTFISKMSARLPNPKKPPASGSGGFLLPKSSAHCATTRPKAHTVKQNALSLRKS